MGKFLENAKSMGLGYAFDCLAADIQYECEIKSFERESERLKRRIDEGKVAPLPFEEIEKGGVVRKRGVSQSDDIKRVVDMIWLDRQQKQQEQEQKKQQEHQQQEILEGSYHEIRELSNEEIVKQVSLAQQMLCDIDKRIIQLVLLTLDFIHLSITPEQFYAAVGFMSKDEFEFVNGIASAFNFGLINPSYSAADYSKYISRENLGRVMTFEVLSTSTPAPTAPKETTPKIPITFGVVEPAQHYSMITAEEINKLQAEFGWLLSQYNYQFNKLYNLYELAIVRPSGSLDIYLLDPGYIFGEGVAILMMYKNRLLPISLKHKKIVQRILSDKQEMLSTAELTECFGSLMPDIIYRNVDMTGWEDISKEDKEMLKPLLIKAIDLPWGGETLVKDLPRLRIKSWEKDHLVLVSDKETKLVDLDPNLRFNTKISDLVIDIRPNLIHVKSIDSAIQIDG